MKYLLDTNIILAYLRDSNIRKSIDEKFNPFQINNIPVISVVSVGEIRSIAIRNNWGEKRIAAVNKFYSKCIIADINSKDVIQKYGEIDAFSQGKLKHKPLGLSARNMGKNDLWIAAIASVTDSKLITTDQDFAHLNDTFLKLELIKI